MVDLSSSTLDEAERYSGAASPIDTSELPLNGLQAQGAHSRVLNMRVDPTTYDAAVETVTRWAANGESRYVCEVNVHSVIESYEDVEFWRAIEEADLVTRAECHSSGCCD